MSGDNSSPLNAEYDHFVKRLESFCPSGNLASSLCGISTFVLDFSGSDGMRSSKKVEINVKALLPAQDTVFCRSTFRNGSYPVVLLIDVCDFYGAFRLSNQTLMQISSSQNSSRSTMAYASIINVYGFSSERISEMAYGFAIAQGIKI